MCTVRIGVHSDSDSGPAPASGVGGAHAAGQADRRSDRQAGILASEARQRPRQNTKLHSTILQHRHPSFFCPGATESNMTTCRTTLLVLIAGAVLSLATVRLLCQCNQP